MTRLAKLIFLFFMVCISISITSFAQSVPVITKEAKLAKIRESIGLDLSVPDFETKRIDAKVMGFRLAGILDYLMEIYQQGVYDRRLSTIVCEQNEDLENSYVQIKKLSFIHAIKQGNEIDIEMKALLQNNLANVKQTVIHFLFKDGLSESDKVNELFSYISHYLQARDTIIVTFEYQYKRILFYDGSERYYKQPNAITIRDRDHAVSHELQESSLIC